VFPILVLKEGLLSMRYMLFFATPSFRFPSHWVFRGARLFIMAEKQDAQGRDVKAQISALLEQTP
jgi:hypothetical protein